MLDDDSDFENKASSASCYVSEIKDFIFGGFSSRFWMLRKHFNCMSIGELQNIPFHSWQCITLQLENRDVDLVIPDQKDMDRVLKLLIHSLNTLNCERGSAGKLLALLNDQA